MAIDDDAASTLSDDDGELAPSFTYDEQTLGRAESVFDAGVDLAPPALAPTAPPPGMMPPAMVPPPSAFGPERPLTAAERRRRVRLEARRVRRVVRHIEPWSVLKVSILFHFVLWLILMAAGLMLWSAADLSGTLESVEELVEDLFALEDQTEGDFFQEGVLLQAYAVITLLLSVAGITFSVLLAVLYNLISDLTGGVRLTVIEEETARFTPPQRRQR